MSDGNVIALPAGARERIEEAVEAAFERQIATTIAFSAIPSNRGQEGPCRSMAIAKALTRRRLQDNPGIGIREVSTRVTAFVSAVRARLDTVNYEGRPFWFGHSLCAFRFMVG